MEEKIDLVFKEAKKEEEVVNLSKFDIQAFTDTQDFSWSLDNIKKEVKTGWKLYSVMTDDEIVAAVESAQEHISAEVLATKFTRDASLPVLDGDVGFNAKLLKS